MSIGSHTYFNQIINKCTVHLLKVENKDKCLSNNMVIYDFNYIFTFQLMVQIIFKIHSMILKYYF